MKTIAIHALWAIAVFSATAAHGGTAVVTIDGKSEGRVFEGLGADRRGLVAAAGGLSRTAAERDSRLSLEAELRRFAPPPEGRDRRRCQLDRRHRAEPWAHAGRIRAPAAGILPARL